MNSFEPRFGSHLAWNNVGRRVSMRAYSSRRNRQAAFELELLFAQALENGKNACKNFELGNVNHVDPSDSPNRLEQIEQGQKSC